VIAADQQPADGQPRLRDDRGGAGGSILPSGVSRALDLVKAPGELSAAIDRLLAGVLVVPDLQAGLDLLRSDPELLVVTRQGDLIGAHWARGGGPAGQSQLGLRVAAEQAAGELAGAQSRCQRAERDLAEAAEDEEAARQALAEVLARVQEADAAAAETSGRLGTLAGAARAAQEEAGRLAAAIAVAERSKDKALAQLADLQGRLAIREAEASQGARDSADSGGDAGDGRAGSADSLADPAGGAADAAGGSGGLAGPAGGAADAAGGSGGLAVGVAALGDGAVAARNAEMEARLEVRTVEERLRAITGRADALASAAAAERLAIQRARERGRRRAAEAAIARAVARGASLTLVRIERSRGVADAEREAAELASKSRGGDLAAVRTAIRELSDELDKAVENAHGAEIARAGRRLRLDQIVDRAAEEFAIDEPTLVADYGPDVPVPQAEEGQQASVFDRGVQEHRAQTAQRLLDQLGKVNPLALEEFSALEERHAFLVGQLEDLKKTRRDLLTVIKEVDDRVQQVFAAAFADTATEFKRIFGVLFPGGEGALVLTEPDDMLATGIDFEARPPGKRVKRLSLLSGGERALTAIAFVVAIFKARPSPFYVLDEVEAALDDTNLQRLLGIFEELRASSQLIIVTHQKRTMEVADSLYGISMRGDGVSAVVSQRLRERESA
jgi:chromosome segregation protein